MDQQGERAIRLVEVNSSGKYVLSEEGKSFISKISGPIAIISVAGMYRTGKSYLLNRMILNRSNGFGVGPTVNPCTKGLWCWGKTIPGKTVDGDTINVIVIDTEGIGALDEDQTHDTRIFTLAILAASSFIYNSTGSIDENALQNLSLVVNLTKNIQLNTHEGQDQEDDPQELAEYFPAFYWVVRDFSLQLVTSEGEQISPKEYLERALAPQKGFSDDVEQKNRIRRLLSSFFKQRECLTLVRPVVDQKKLQHLDSLEMDQLRPEFVDQVMSFRRRVLGRVKPKVFKGKELDGPMYLCLLSSYVQAINNGAVPNIENAWNYMCQQKCAQAFENSLNLFNEQVEKQLRCAFPIDEDYLKTKLKDIKQKACQKFQANSVGQKTKFHLTELREKLELKIEQLRIQNQQQSQSVLISYFKKSIIEIQNKLRLRQYVSFEQFNKQLNQFYGLLMENGPNLPRKDTVFLSLLKKVIPAAAEIFLRDRSQQLKNFKALSEQKQTTLQSIIDNLKRNIKQTEETNKQKFTKMDRKRVELELEIQDLKKTTQELKLKNSQIETKFQIELKESVDSNKRKEELLQQKLASLNNQINQLQNDSMTYKYEQQKESALITMKNKQISLELEQIKRKQAQTMLSLKNLQVENSKTIKNIREEYEQKVRQRDIQLRKTRTNLNDLEEHNRSLEQQLSQTQNESQNQILRLKQSLNKKQADLVRLSKDKEDQENSNKRRTQEEVSELNTELTKYIEKFNEIERQLKSQVESSKTKQMSFQTEQVLLKQKYQFSQSEVKQLRSQLEKIKKDNEERIASLIEQCSTKTNLNNKIQEIEESYEKKLTQLKSDNEVLQKKYSSETDSLNSQLSDLQIQLRNLKNKYTSQIDQQNKLIESLQQNLRTQQGNVTDRVDTMQGQWKRKEKNYVQKISKLEEQLEQIKDEMSRQQREQNEKSQQVVLQLKNYYQIEKEKLESKIIFEKEKYERKIAELVNEYEQKHQQETNELEEQCQMLKERLSELEDEFMKEKTNRKIEADIKNKAISDLQKLHEQSKSRIDNRELDLVNKIDKMQKEHNIEKQTLYLKIEELHTRQNKIEKEKASLCHSKEQVQKMLQIRQKTLEEIKQQLAAIKLKSDTEKESEKALRNDISTKLMQQRVQFQKKMALLSQQNEYLKIKIDDNQKSMTSYQNIYQDKLRKAKEQFSQQLKLSIEKSQNQIESLQQKHDKLKKLSKQKEVSMQKTINQLQKDSAISNEKMLNMIQKLKVYEEKQLSQNEQYSSHLTTIKSNLTKQKQHLKELLEQQQKEKQKIENQKNILNAAYQQEKMLLENKNKFLQEGKERYKQDYEETKSKLQLIIENNRKKWAQQKISLQHSHTEHLAKIDKKHWQQKQELTDNLKKLENEYENKIKSIQFENRTLNEKLAAEEQNKMGTQNVSDRKLKQMTDNQKRLQTELDRLKVTRESQLVQLENQQKQKQSLKQKLKQKQNKYTALQKLKQHSFFQFEKQKAKWKMEKQNTLQKYDELKQVITKHEKQIQKLQRQNQKLKVQKKCQKSSIQSRSLLGSAYTINRTSLEESILKQNCGNTSQISDKSLFFQQ